MQLFTWHLPLCSKSWLHFWWTSYLFWQSYISLQSLLLPHLLTLLYSAVPRFVFCLYHCSVIHSKLVILYTINSQSFNCSVSSRSRTLAIYLICRLALKLSSPVISLPSYAISTGSKSLNMLNISSCHLPTKFSQLAHLHTFITSCLFSVLTVLALRPSLLLLTDIMLSKK